MTTPMMQQYRDAKERHPGMLLLFRMGDFYELFHDDAEVVSRVLGLTLTSRDSDVPMAGVPHNAIDTYLRKLLQAGHRVAICDQVEDAALAKGLVRREVTRVVTPGTFTEDDLLDPRQANYLVALTAPGPQGAIGLAWVDPSTGLFHAADVSSQRLVDELARLAPAECLVPEKLLAQETSSPLEQLRACLPGLALTARPDWNFDADSARAMLFHHFQVTTLAGFGFDDGSPCLSAAGALVLYLQETLKSSLAHISRLRPHAENRFLFLDEVTRRSLELTRTLRDGARQGSLLAVMDRTVTPMGARLLADWLLTPLADRAAIERRLDAVAELLAEHALRSDVRAHPRRRLRPAAADVPGQHRPGVAAKTCTRLAGPWPCCRASRRRWLPALGTAAKPGKPARALCRPARAAGVGPGRRPAADRARGRRHPPRLRCRSR